MNGLVPISSSTLLALVAVAGERASMRFLEFLAANIRNPHTRRAYYRAAEEFLLRERRRTLDRRRPAGARRHLDRGGDTRTGRTLGQTTARRPCVTCSTGWSTARSCRSTRHTQCAGLGMS